MAYEEGYNKHQNIDKQNMPLQSSYNACFDETPPNIEGAHGLFDDTNVHFALRSANINDIEESLTEMQRPWVLAKTNLENKIKYFGGTATEYEAHREIRMGEVVYVDDTEEVFFCIEDIYNAPVEIDRTKFILLNDVDMGFDALDTNQIKLELNQELGQALIQNKTADSFGTEVWETVAYWYSALVCNPSYEVAPVFIAESDEYEGLYLMFIHDENTHTTEQVYPITVAEAVFSSLGNVGQQVKDLESMVKGIYGEAV